MPRTSVKNPGDGVSSLILMACHSQAAGLEFFPTATGAWGVAGDFGGQADDVIGLGDFSDEAIVLLDYRNPLFVHEVLDQEQNSFRGNAVRARRIDAHAAHLHCQPDIPSGAQPAEVEFRALPTEVDD